jgi:Secretion system C-terminal sorting domain/Matrixin
MKLIIIVIIAILAKGILVAQPCGQPTNCPNKEYSYTVYSPSEGKLVQKCLRDPQSSSDPVMKAELPICLIFETSAPEIVSVGNASNGNILEVYRRSDIGQDELNAEDAWNCLCNTMPPPCACEIKYKFSDDINDFAPTPEKTVGRAQMSVSASRSKCQTYCEGSSSPSIICLNNTKEWTGSESHVGLKSDKFFVNDSYLLNDPNYLNGLPPDTKVFNISDIITHELGHLLGLDHHTMISGGSEVKKCAEESDGLMNATTAGNNAKTSLSNDDICMFKKLYCPTLVGVNDFEDDPDENNAKARPNPLNTYTTLSFETFDLVSDVSIFLYNSQGQFIKEVFSGKRGLGTHEIQINASDLNLGIYFCRIIINNKNFGMKLIVNR